MVALSNYGQWWERRNMKPSVNIARLLADMSPMVVLSVYWPKIWQSIIAFVTFNHLLGACFYPLLAWKFCFGRQSGRAGEGFVRGQWLFDAGCFHFLSCVQLQQCVSLSTGRLPYDSCCL